MSPEAIRAAWLIGDLRYKLRNLQKKVRLEMLASTALKYYIECTRRFGKSTLLLILLAEVCIRKPGAKAGFYAPVKEGLSDYVKPIVDKVFADCPPDLMPKLDSTLTLNFPNGSVLIFRGSNNQQYRLRRGNDLDIAAIDEGRDVDDLPDLVESVVIPSLFTAGSRLILSSTPADTQDHPLHAYREAAEAEGALSHYTIMDAHRYDPDDFSMSRIERWKKETTDPIAWEREYMAAWVKDPTKTVIPEWCADFVQEVQRDEFFKFYHKYAAMDLGVSDKTAGIFGYYEFSKARLVIEDEFAMKDAEVRTDRIADVVKDKEAMLAYQLIHDRKDPKYAAQAPNEHMFRRVADNNNPLLLQDLNGLYGLDFYGTMKDELAAMINLCREWVKDGRVIVNPRCKELIGCLQNAVWDKRKRELSRSAVYGHFDALMALVYLVRNVDTQTNPIPKFYGKSYATHAIPVQAPQQQGNLYTLARAFGVRTDQDQARENFTKGKI